MKLYHEKVLDKKGFQYAGKGSMASRVYEEVERVIKQSKTPVKTELREVSAGLLSGKKKFLLVSGKMKKYVIGISAEAYGDYLCVDVYLTKEPGFLDKLRGAVATVASRDAALGSSVMHAANLNVFESQELDNVWSTTTASVHEALELLGLTENQRGFGNIA
jgi:hypothetical protein